MSMSLSPSLNAAVAGAINAVPRALTHALTQIDEVTASGSGYSVSIDMVGLWVSTSLVGLQNLTLKRH